MFKFGESSRSRSLSHMGVTRKLIFMKLVALGRLGSEMFWRDLDPDRFHHMGVIHQLNGWIYIKLFVELSLG